MPHPYDSSTSDPLIGSVLKDYRIDAPLGSGGMGMVYRAYDTRLKRTVAVKTIRAEIAAKPNAIARLKREARAAAALNHPAIATLLDYDQVDGTHFLVFEHLAGVSLREYVRLERPRIADVVRIAQQIAQALAAAHDHGIIHRDLKPENVMVLPDGSVKVLDFGLALLFDDAVNNLSTSPNGAPLTGEGTLVGTLQYMAPEQLEGRSVDHRVDVFGFGVLCYELLTGRHPFAGTSPAETIANIVQCKATPLSAINPEIPAPLVALVERCMSRAASARYDRASVLAADLAALQSAGAMTTSATTHRLAAPEYVLPRNLARTLFCCVQLAYVVMYLIVFRNSAGLDDALASALSTTPFADSSVLATGTVLTTALVGLAVRLYLISLVVWDHVRTGVMYRQVFLLFFVLDGIWALTPLALLEKWGVLALPAVAPLAFSPFAQRTLIRSAYDPFAPRRISTG